LEDVAKSLLSIDASVAGGDTANDREGRYRVGWRRALRLSVLLLVGLLPSAVKRVLYRLLFGYRIDARVSIGLALLDARTVHLEEGVEIGHFNAITRVTLFRAGRRARIGTGNIVRGGERVTLGDYAEILRLNVLNAIPDHDCTTEPRSVLEVGAGAVITSGHRIDFTDRVTLGKNVIVGGRNSSLWTHNRQETAPIEIGDFCYLGSEVRLAPGAKLPDECILGLGSVLTGEIEETRSLVAGVPAKVVRPLNEKDLARIRRKTRADMPDDYYERS
jgi:acetyltransferase-like isoleucine patch superfamily enzyme